VITCIRHVEIAGRSLGIVAASGLITGAGCSALRTAHLDGPCRPAPKTIPPDAKIRFGLVGVGGRAGRAAPFDPEQKKRRDQGHRRSDETARDKALGLIESSGVATPEE